MAIRFVLGPAGSGKTYHCISAIAAELERQPLGPPLLFILPEQATFIHERMLMEHLSAGVYSRSWVTSLERLCLQAQSWGGKAPLPALSSGGRCLLAAAVASDCQDKLNIYGAAAGRAGFAGQMAQAVEELENWGVGPDSLNQAAEQALSQGQELAAGRLQELALLYQNHQAHAAGRYGSRWQQLEYLCTAIEGGWLDEAQVYVDGFSSFTQGERRVLLALARHCADLEICLPVDPEEAERLTVELSVFSSVWEEYGLLRREMLANKLEIKPPLLLLRGKGRYTEKKELALVEQYFAGAYVPEAEVDKEQGQHKLYPIHLYPAANRREELERAGREIIRLVREQGWHYRDCCLIVRSIEPYRELLAEVFPQLGLAYFLDDRQSLLSHGLIELVRAIFQAWLYQPERQRLFRYLKNPLSGLSREETDILENYSLAHGLRRWHWQDGFSRIRPLPGESETLTQEMETLAERGVRPLLELLSDWGEEASAPRINQGLKQLFSRLNIEARLEQAADQAAADGDGALAEWQRQAWPRLWELLEEAERLLGEDNYSCRQLAELYEAALSGLSLATIPPGLDQVFVGSLERSRIPEVKAAFVLGVNEGALPQRITYNGLLGDEERHWLEQVGAVLGPDRHQLQFQEEYLAYVGLTRSSQWLWISYPCWEQDGSQLAPSSLIHKLQKLFPHLEPEAPQLSAELLCGGGPDLSRAAAGMQQQDKQFWPEVYAWFRQQEKLSPELNALERGWQYHPRKKPLDKELQQQLYGDKLYSSVSRLEGFRQCPLAYFAGYGLKLQPRREYRMLAQDKGELCHNLLAAIGQRIQAEGNHWEEIDREKAEILVEEELAGAEQDFLGGLLQSNNRYLYLRRRLRQLLIRSLLALSAQINRGGFLPIAFELSFGPGGELPVWRIPLGENKELLLSGRIDRVDRALSPDGKRAYFRVIDYKTGNISISPEDIAAGVRAQLMVYLQVVLAGYSLPHEPEEAEALPAGMFYAGIQDGLVSGDKGEPGMKLGGLAVADTEAIDLADPGLSGYSQILPLRRNKDGSLARKPFAPSPEELAALAEDMTGSLCRSASAILEGQIMAAPLRDKEKLACDRCAYQALCGFDREQVRPIRRKDICDKWEREE